MESLPNLELYFETPGREMPLDTLGSNPASMTDEPNVVWDKCCIFSLFTCTAGRVVTPTDQVVGRIQ